MVEWYEKWPKWIRWLFLIPVSALGAFAIRWIAIFSFNFATMEFLEDSLFEILYLWLFDGPVLALLFLNIAYKVAPAAKNAVVVVLAFISSILMFTTCVVSPDGFISEIGAECLGYIFASLYVCVIIALGRESREWQLLD